MAACRGWIVAGGVALLVGAGAVHAAQVECRSEGYHYNYCRVDTQGVVRMLQQQSSSPCDRGRSWGYDRRGIWVDDGCSAVFEYGYGGGYDGAASRGRGDDGALVAGVAALAIIGAIASSQHHADRPHYEPTGPRVPGWAIGSFSGSDSESGADMGVRIDPYGQIDGYYGHRQLTGQFDGDRAYLGGRGYSAYATRDGFRLVADDDGRMVIDFYRD